MNVQEKQVGEVVVLELSGRIMGGPDASLLNDKLHELIDRGKVHIVADIGGVEWMNSSGLGILISGLTTMRNNGGELKLVHVTERIQNLLMITKLLTVFETYESLEQAIASFH
ncbi:MAG: STAS domain-containing protein [candidate division KSB1 bacterium]|nr:STAS domain-containing protein [candidate division KSB1 bacterium]MDZ7274845.1 STAS domain-containing protein [candidate division KSB1 bacterium]MDZ7288212.1 STAS domain-containing protein [candidate division KSB1 bacterium]MDZ7300407.1 STAS domain-containing protein [candidate division KSB1 bacterium]MDZ7308782.1 STAS domain-containing protein [candidate division KSB1 bacterium]